jgi:hypothetical protein
LTYLDISAKLSELERQMPIDRIGNDTRITDDIARPDVAVLAAYFYLCEGRTQDVWEANRPLLPGEVPLRVEDYDDRASAFLAALGDTLPHLRAEQTPEDMMWYFYEAGKAHYGVSNLRGWFRDIYYLLYQVPDGVRIGNLIEVWGLDNFLEQVRHRLNTVGGLA